MKFALALLAVLSVAEATWKSGSVSTYDKFTYGKIVARMKHPNKRGTVSSIYTFWDGPGFYPGGWNEIDMNIVPSVAGTPLSTNVVYGDGLNKSEDHAYHAAGGDSDWHTYTIEWTPNHVFWWIDDHEVRDMESDRDAVKYLHKDQHLRLNFWTPTFHAWGADFNAADMPWYLLFDWIEVYNWNKDTGAFDMAWRDDFNTFDQTRWHKVSGGFEGNSSSFSPQNAYVSGGNLVLKLEPMDGHHLHEHHVDHTHYSSESHRMERELHHMEADSELIRDAIEPKEHLLHVKSELGHLEPRMDVK